MQENCLCIENGSAPPRKPRGNWVGRDPVPSAGLRLDTRCSSQAHGPGPSVVPTRVHAVPRAGDGFRWLTVGGGVRPAPAAPAWATTILTAGRYPGPDRSPRPVGGGAKLGRRWPRVSRGGPGGRRQPPWASAEPWGDWRAWAEPGAREPRATDAPPRAASASGAAEWARGTPLRARADARPEGTRRAAVGAGARALFLAPAAARVPGRVFLPQVPAAAPPPELTPLPSVSPRPRQDPRGDSAGTTSSVREASSPHASHLNQKEEERKKKKKRKSGRSGRGGGGRRRGGGAARGGPRRRGDAGTRLCAGGSWGAHGGVWPGRRRRGPAHLPGPGPRRQGRPESRSRGRRRRQRGRSPRPRAGALWQRRGFQWRLQPRRVRGRSPGQPRQGTSRRGARADP